MLVQGRLFPIGGDVSTKNVPFPVSNLTQYPKIGAEKVARTLWRLSGSSRGGISDFLQDIQEQSEWQGGDDIYGANEKYPVLSKKSCHRSCNSFQPIEMAF
jgi:hypothetical protein